MGNIYIGSPNSPNQNIYIGGPGDNINIGGNVTYITSNITQISDPTFTLNKGGTTFNGSGLEIENNGSIAASLKLDSAGNWIVSDGNTGVYNLHSIGMGDYTGTGYTLKADIAQITGNLSAGNVNTGNANISGNLAVGGYDSTYHRMRVDGNVHFGINNNYDINKYGIVTVTTADADGTSALALVRKDNYVWKVGYKNDGSNDLYVYDGTGGVRLTAGNSQNWSTPSDRRFKKNISEIYGALEKIREIRGVYYNYLTDPEGSERKVGVIAQELYAVLPEVVDMPVKEENPMTVRYSEIVALLINGMKEMDRRLIAIEEQLHML